jgi:hypothetical protein
MALDENRARGFIFFADEKAARHCQQGYAGRNNDELPFPEKDSLQELFDLLNW